MARTIPVHCDGKLAYHIEIRDSFAELTDKLMEAGFSSGQKVCIVSDSNVAAIYLENIEKLLKDKFSVVTSFCFTAGEASKNMDTVQELYEHLIIHNYDRHDFLIALGGGVVGDLTGFAAATYLRGIDFVQIPTSLLAQVDSSIGGKTGVDFKQYKNMVGAFHQPKLVYMNLHVLDSLPLRQISSGTAEILKHGLIKDASYFLWMKENQKKVFDLDIETLEEMIYRSCNIKREVVENDPTEKGDRALLNFGHTLGHAVEKLSDFQLYHGECVAIGSAAAAYLSMKQGYLTQEDYTVICDTLQAYQLPVCAAKQSAQDILKTSKSDKKMKADKIHFILLHKIGEAFIESELTDDDLLGAIDTILEEEA